VCTGSILGSILHHIRLALPFYIFLSFFLYFTLSFSRIAFSGLARSHARHPRQATPANELTYTDRSTRTYTRTRKHVAWRFCRAQGLIIHVMSTPHHKESATGTGGRIFHSGGINAIQLQLLLITDHLL